MSQLILLISSRQFFHMSHLVNTSSVSQSKSVMKGKHKDVYQILNSLNILM